MKISRYSHNFLLIAFIALQKLFKRWKKQGLLRASIYNNLGFQFSCYLKKFLDRTKLDKVCTREWAEHVVRMRE